jgi:hypothetical protein
MRIYEIFWTHPSYYSVCLHDHRALFFLPGYLTFFFFFSFPMLFGVIQGLRERAVGCESLYFLEQVMQDLKPNMDVSVSPTVFL